MKLYLINIKVPFFPLSFIWTCVLDGLSHNSSSKVNEDRPAMKFLKRSSLNFCFIISRSNLWLMLGTSWTATYKVSHTLSKSFSFFLYDEEHVYNNSSSCRIFQGALIRGLRFLWIWGDLTCTFKPIRIDSTKTMCFLCRDFVSTRRLFLLWARVIQLFVSWWRFGVCLWDRTTLWLLCWDSRFKTWVEF